ncbi:MAG: acyl-CoA dehydrogenase family protein [Gemmataceae bacterium]|nr:acyl-CoA dehydrogenase family protein [Gemmata sp.]MDW8196617.1 acyl-CoA dehydrogenase family protein [Gemmataceae bacterium]
MSAVPETERDQASFAETALRLSGKSEEEAQRLGAVDKADEHVEKLYAQRLQTAASPVHQAVWERQVPLEMFQPPPLPATAPCDAAMERCLAVVRQHRDAGTIYDDNGKIAPAVIDDLARAGFWGLLIPPEYGGQGAPFTRYARFHTQLSVLEEMIAGMGSVHGCIGAVDPLKTFGTPEQKRRFLPRLATGETRSAFALTEPGAGSDLTALRTVAIEAGNDFAVTGEKLFITHCLPGRTIGLVVMLHGQPAVLIAELPPHETDEFQIVPYKLHALRRGYNNGLRFNNFKVPRDNLLVPAQGNGLTIAYHGLNHGRVMVCAGAAGSMRVMLASILPWAKFRKTYGAPIAQRELVQRRIARLAALIAGADALVAWCSWLIEEGYRGELECIIAKIFGSEALKEAAIELVMKTHGGRAFLGGHYFGDNVHDLLAPCIYEGEGEMLGLAFFKSLIKEHGKAYFEPIGRRLQQYQMKTLNPLHPQHVWRFRRELWSYGRWRLAQHFRRRDRTPVVGLPAKLQAHVDFARECLAQHRREISATMVQHQLKLADRQCRMAELSQRVQDTIVMLVTALWAGQQPEEVSQAAADILCQDLQRRLTGQRPSDRYFRDVRQLAEMVLAGEYPALRDVPVPPILRPYAND